MKAPKQSNQLVESKCLINFILREEFDDLHPNKKLRIIDSMNSKCYFLIKTDKGYCCARDELRQIIAAPFKDINNKDHDNIQFDDYDYALISSTNCPLAAQKKTKSKDQSLETNSINEKTLPN